MSRLLRRFALACIVTGIAGGSWAQMRSIYTCIDAKGRRLTADRPIAECLDREQKELSGNGTVRRTHGPSLTPVERAAQEDRDRKAAAGNSGRRRKRMHGCCWPAIRPAGARQRPAPRRCRPCRRSQRPAHRRTAGPAQEDRGGGRVPQDAIAVAGQAEAAVRGQRGAAGGAAALHRRSRKRNCASASASTRNSRA